MKLQVTNIARNLTELDLRKLFTKYGPITECTLVMDAKTQLSKGFGFVVYTNSDAARRAVEAVNGREVEGIKIKVKIVAEA